VLRITPTDRAALQFLAEGNSTSEVARRLAIAEDEIERYLTALFATMGAASRTEAIATAVRRGLLAVEATSPSVHASLF
jgi:DNA-binding NarL/FixJ family response regulator